MRDGYEYYTKRVFSKIENGQLKTLLNSYLEGLYTTLEVWTFNRIFNEMINSFENVKITDLTWDLMCNQIRNMKSGYKYLIRFYGYAQKSGACLGCHDEYLKRNSWILFDNKDIHVNESNISKFYFSGGSPENFFIISNGKFPPCYIYIDTANSKLNKIFNLFIKFREGLLTNEVMLADFLRNFELSLGQYSSLINDMRDFNYETFDTQFKYFSTDDDKKRQIRIFYLKSFYVFLIRFFEDIREKHDVLNIEHGIDKAFLCKENFSTLYEEGVNGKLNHTHLRQ
ncbi:hypothetical protein Desor_0943 [Desulfosporosinus orientis DSM 765]|uniref:Uncharacterized protein n=1 Tax=Desulfosporosinus orientis (strain ATCC 19365 / DSM 765 / NCIMB 8382 / VKM B-1628 / Singapore I) TaxID=768706 RepID=G7W5H2_DESOD|nr:hypothetical protein [Desulfosporosinus orientis]AET66619.1 hypothetical protein Desor_0943 [Desulfosporosinus orientis DSM 765]